MKPQRKQLPPIVIYDRRLDGGRLSLRPRTTDRRVRNARELAVRFALENKGAAGVASVERLRRGELHISDFQSAYESGDWGTVLAAALPEDGPAGRRAESELGPLLLGTQVDEYIAGAALRRSSRDRYEAIRKAAVAHFGESHPMREVLTADAERFLTGQGWAPATQAQALTFLKSTWDRVIDLEREAGHHHGREPRLVLNPWQRKRAGRAGGVRLPRTKRTPRHAWIRPEKWAELAARTRGTPRLALYALGTLAGLRQQEVANLRTDVDLVLNPEGEGGVIYVREREGQYPWKAKTERSVREVPIPSGGELEHILREHVRHGFAGVYFLHAPGADRPLGSTTIETWTRDDFNAVGLTYGRGEETYTFHSTRHTFASWAIQRKVGLVEVAELMGDTVDMVVKHYGHLAEKNRHQAMREIEAAAAGDDAAPSRVDEVVDLRRLVADLREQLARAAA